MNIHQSNFGKSAHGENIDLFTLINDRGNEIQVINYGARILSIKVPDKEGKKENVVLGYASLDDYLKDQVYLGAVVGRYANRIKNGTFTLDGKGYQLAKNNNGNHLHGGEVGFDKKVWKATKLHENNKIGVKFYYMSPHMEEGYPGNLKVTVSYWWNDQHKLEINFEATTDRTTIINLTQHAYFNLSGNAKRSTLDHILELDANRYCPVDDRQIPKKQMEQVEGTPFDFRKPERIGARVDHYHVQIAMEMGYDHSFVLNTGPWICRYPCR